VWHCGHWLLKAVSKPLSLIASGMKTSEEFQNLWYNFQSTAALANVPVLHNHDHLQGVNNIIHQNSKMPGEKGVTKRW